MVNAFLDHEYTARNQVPDATALINEWTARSKVARALLDGHFGLRYGETPRQYMDIFPAAGSSTWLVFAHGGYWRATGKDDYTFLAPPFLEAGINVVILDYDLRPDATIPEITEQCRRGTAWAWGHAAQFSGAPERFIVSGHSAGGHITGMLFATHWPDYGVPADAITGGIGLSGLYDLTPLRKTRMNDAFLNLSAAEALAHSPVNHAPTVNAPLALVAGELESSEFHRQNKLLHGEPGWDAITSDLMLAAGCHHFNIFDAFTDLAHPMWAHLQR